MLETSNFVHGSAMQSLSLVMSECFLSGRGQGHESNFYFVDLENFATASRRYTCIPTTCCGEIAGDIHNSTGAVVTFVQSNVSGVRSCRCVVCSR